MKLTQERPAPVKAQSPEAPAQLAQEGKSMTPPSFQLQASQGEAPVQAKLAPGQEKENEAAQLMGDVMQRQEADPAHAGMCMDTATPASPEWEYFATQFNEEFKSILHVFEPAQNACGEGTEAEAASKAPTYSKIGEASGAALTGAQLEGLFTEGQREKILSFMATREIPERLFNGDDVGNTTAQQRLLMASHILVAGKYKPGSFEQKVHARMCWHWVHITHHYAGATPAGALNQGMMGMSDHNNDVVLGSGKNESIFHGKGVKPEDLPAEYNAAEHIGPMPKDSDHEKAAKAEQEKKAKDPEAKSTIKMLKTMPFEDFGKIQPGDWIWYYNANGSGIGSHSVIFSRWTSDVQTDAQGVRYRKAICFSQGQPEWGGREHTANLGERFSKTEGLQISPINYVTRVSQDANPADTVDELLPKGAEKKEKALQGTNEKYIAQVEKQFKKPIDRTKVLDILRAENVTHIEKLGDRITDGQRELLELANASDELETLVRLTQRLRILHNNTDINEANQEKTNAAKGLDYDKISAKVAAEEAVIDAEILKLDTEKADLEKKIAEDTTQKDTLDTGPEAKAKKGEFDKLDRDIKAIERKHKKNPEALKTDEDYLKLKAQRDTISGELKELKTTGASNKKEIERLKAEIAKLKKKLAANGWSHTAQDKKRAKTKKQLPFSLVHPGSWKGEMKGGTTGKLADVLKAAQFEPALGEGELPKPEVKQKPKGKGKAK